MSSGGSMTIKKAMTSLGLEVKYKNHNPISQVLMYVQFAGLKGGADTHPFRPEEDRSS